MKAKHVLLASACLAACAGGKVENADGGKGAAAEVTVTHAIYGTIPKETILRATTAYQNKAVVASPVPSFASEVYVWTGKRVEAGALLYRLESKEQHALGYGNAPIEIRAARHGIVLGVQAQAGSYVAEGTALCTIAEAGSLVFEINVPGELGGRMRIGSRCTLELPDGTRLRATVRTLLATMDEASQSEKLVATADEAPFLPEGMNVKAVFTSASTAEAVMLLPKAAVQSDETLTAHWVMRLAGDSIAVKVPVTVGNYTVDSIEVQGPLTPADHIVLTGGYALADSSRVIIRH